MQTRLFSRNYVIVLCLILWFGFDTLVSPELASRRGTRDAEADLSREVLAYRLRGKLTQHDRDFERIAVEKYGFGVVRTGYCCATSIELNYDSAYNAVVRQHLIERWKFDPIERAFKEARQPADAVTAGANP